MGLVRLIVGNLRVISCETYFSQLFLVRLINGKTLIDPLWEAIADFFPDVVLDSAARMREQLVFRLRPYFCPSPSLEPKWNTDARQLLTSARSRVTAIRCNVEFVAISAGCPRGVF